MPNAIFISENKDPETNYGILIPQGDLNEYSFRKLIEDMSRSLSKGYRPDDVESKLHQARIQHRMLPYEFFDVGLDTVGIQDETFDVVFLHHI